MAVGNIRNQTTVVPQERDAGSVEAEVFSPGVQGSRAPAFIGQLAPADGAGPPRHQVNRHPFDPQLLDVLVQSGERPPLTAVSGADLVQEMNRHIEDARAEDQRDPLTDLVLPQFDAGDVGSYMQAQEDLVHEAMQRYLASTPC